MKSKLLLVVVLALGLVAGFFLGRLQVTRSVDKYWASLATPETRHAMAAFSHAAGLLKAVDRGDTNEVVQTLEEDLDTNILLLGAAVQEITLSEHDKQQCYSRIRWLREHRTAHPWKASLPEMDEQVAHVLSLTETNR